MPAHNRTGTIQDVEHIVFLMQENRSFDHYFGTLRGVRGFGDPRAGAPAVGQAGVVPARRRRRAAAVPSGRATSRHAVPRRTRRTAGPTRTAPGTAAIRSAGSRTRARRRWRISPAPTSRSTTRSPMPSRSATPTTARCSGRPIRTAITCGPAGSATTARRRPRHRQRRSGLRLVDLSGAAGASRHLVEDLPGHRPRTGCRAETGAGPTIAYIGNYGDNSLLYFHQYQNAPPGSRSVRARRARGTNIARRHAVRCTVRHPARRRAPRRLPQVSWIVAPEAFTEHPQLALELRRLVHVAGARRR